MLDFACAYIRDYFPCRMVRESIEANGDATPLDVDVHARSELPECGGQPFMPGPCHPLGVRARCTLTARHAAPNVVHLPACGARRDLRTWQVAQRGQTTQ